MVVSCVVSRACSGPSPCERSRPEALDMEPPIRPGPPRPPGGAAGGHGGGEMQDALRRMHDPERGMDIETPQGVARAHVRPSEDARAVLALGHGAGGSVSAPDIVAAAGAALDAGVTV